MLITIWFLTVYVFFFSIRWDDVVERKLTYEHLYEIRNSQHVSPGTNSFGHRCRRPNAADNAARDKFGPRGRIKSAQT